MNICSVRTHSACLYALFPYDCVFPNGWHEMLVVSKVEEVNEAARFPPARLAVPCARDARSPAP